MDAAAAPGAAEIAPRTRMGPVHLTVSDLGRSLIYYRDTIGLTIRDRIRGRASLGRGDRELLVLVEQSGARPYPGSTGLYHIALLVPRRADLARWLAHAARDRVAMTGMSDHFVSEALYLSDPDEHGIEIYWDRPRSAWEGAVAATLTTAPLDVPGLLAELPDPSREPFEGLPAETVVGHVHLRVASIPETVTFYRDVLGFALMAQLGSQAAFLSAGGYHHHIGANTWESAGGQPAPEGAAALRHATIVLPHAEALRHVVGRLDAAGVAQGQGEGGLVVRDPSGNALALTVA